MCTNGTSTCLCWASHLIRPFTSVHRLSEAGAIILILQGRKPRLRVQFFSSLPWCFRSPVKCGLTPFPGWGAHHLNRRTIPWNQFPMLCHPHHAPQAQVSVLSLEAKGGPSLHLRPQRFAGNDHDPLFSPLSRLELPGHQPLLLG